MRLSLDSYTVSAKGDSPIKGAAIWGSFSGGCSCAPLCYLRKPGWLSEAQFAAVVRSIRLEAPPDLLEAQRREGDE